MPSHFVQYYSPKMLIGLLSKDNETEIQFDNCTITENYQFNSHSHIADGLGEYQLIISSEISSMAELSSLKDKSIQISDLIDKLWTYISYSPYSVPEFGRELIGTNIYEPPKGWSTNAKLVKNELDKLSNGVSCSYGKAPSTYWHFRTNLPLKMLHIGLNNYKELSAEYIELIELHYKSFILKRTDAQLFCLAKGMEIIYAILSFDKRKKRHIFLKIYMGY